MTGMTDMVRREIRRQASNARDGFRAVLRSIGLTTKVQRISAEGLSGETLEKLEHFQQFGFTSAPPGGTELIVLPLGGRTSASVIVATEHGATRFVLDNQGESCVYNQWGDFAHFKKDRSIHVKAEEKVFVETKVFRVEATTRIELVSPQVLVEASGKVRVESPLHEMTGLLQTQQLTIGLTGAGTATMNGGTLNFNSVALNYQSCTTTYTGGSITHDGKAIDKTHTHGGVQTGAGNTSTPN